MRHVLVSFEEYECYGKTRVEARFGNVAVARILFDNVYWHSRSVQRLAVKPMGKYENVCRFGLRFRSTFLDVLGSIVNTE